MGSCESSNAAIEQKKNDGTKSACTDKPKFDNGKSCFAKDIEPVKCVPQSIEERKDEGSKKAYPKMAESNSRNLSSSLNSEASSANGKSRQRAPTTQRLSLQQLKDLSDNEDEEETLDMSLRKTFCFNTQPSTDTTVQTENYSTSSGCEFIALSLGSHHSGSVGTVTASEPVDVNRECHLEPPEGAQLIKRATLRRMKEKQNEADLEDKYKVQWNKVLGEGAFGAVYSASSFKTGEKVAVKRISKKYTDQREFKREMDALLTLQARGGHPNICSLREHFDEGKDYFLVLDLIRGGEMFDHLIEMGAYSEADAARLLREVASALAFCHGIGIIHGDLKPENIMLSTKNSSDAVIQLVDFGASEVIVELEDDEEEEKNDGEEEKKTAEEHHAAQIAAARERTVEDRGRTPAYCPPELLASKTLIPRKPSMDMWSVGVIMFIMLTGLHPFDLTGSSSDDEVKACILRYYKKCRSSGKPTSVARNPKITSHLSASATELMERLLNCDPTKRLTAMQMLNHPWIQGTTACTTKFADAPQNLRTTYRRFQSSIERKVFEDIIEWSNNSPQDVLKKTSLVERAFRSLDLQRKGYLTTRDLHRCSTSDAADLNSSASEDETEEELCLISEGNGRSNEPLSLSGFSDLLSENMKNRYFDKGQVVYTEGDLGHHMYFINSGTIEVTTKEGSVSQRTQGDFFGEGALLHPKQIRSGTITCVTPVHALEISREYFDKYLAESKRGLSFSLREIDRSRKRDRAKRILQLQSTLQRATFEKGDHLFREGEEGDALFIVEQGVVEVLMDGYPVFHVREGDVVGEYPLILRRPRNANAVVISDGGCVAMKLPAVHFYDLYQNSNGTRDSLRELCLRREFQKALVRKIQKPFVSADLNAVFEMADEDKDGVLSLGDLTKLLVELDHSLSKEEILDILGSMDLTKNGSISLQEFLRIFSNDLPSDK